MMNATRVAGELALELHDSPMPLSGLLEALHLIASLREVDGGANAWRASVDQAGWRIWDHHSGAAILISKGYNDESGTFWRADVWEAQELNRSES